VTQVEPSLAMQIEHAAHTIPPDVFPRQCAVISKDVDQETIAAERPVHG
jgi:hypothetical protein